MEETKRGMVVTGDAFIGYNFNEDVSIYKIEITNSGYSSGDDQQYGIKDFTLQYCDQNGIWQDVKEFENKKELLAKTTFYTNNNVSASKWRIYITTTWDSFGRRLIGELQFFGK